MDTRDNLYLKLLNASTTDHHHMKLIHILLFFDPYLINYILLLLII